MVDFVSAGWNLVTAVAFLVGSLYSYRLYLSFRGGKLARKYSLSLWAFVVLFATFALSALFNFANISPTSYDVSVKDLGVLVAGVLLVASLREASKFWVKSM